MLTDHFSCRISLFCFHHLDVFYIRMLLKCLDVIGRKRKRRYESTGAVVNCHTLIHISMNSASVHLISFFSRLLLQPILSPCDVRLLFIYTIPNKVHNSHPSKSISGFESDSYIFLFSASLYSTHTNTHSNIIHRLTFWLN